MVKFQMNVELLYKSFCRKISINLQKVRFGSLFLMVFSEEFFFQLSCYLSLEFRWSLCHYCNYMADLETITIIKINLNDRIIVCENVSMYHGSYNADYKILDQYKNSLQVATH